MRQPTAEAGHRRSSQGHAPSEALPEAMHSRKATPEPRGRAGTQGSTLHATGFQVPPVLSSTARMWLAHVTNTSAAVSVYVTAPLFIKGTTAGASSGGHGCTADSGRRLAVPAGGGPLRMRDSISRSAAAASAGRRMRTDFRSCSDGRMLSTWPWNCREIGRVEVSMPKDGQGADQESIHRKSPRAQRCHHANKEGQEKVVQLPSLLGPTCT